MDLYTSDIPADGQGMRQKVADNFKKIINEDANDDSDRRRIDQKYQIKTDDLFRQCNDLKDGEVHLDSTKLDKLVFFHWWKELDDKVNHYFDELDDKKASKKRMKQTFAELSNLIQKYHDEIVKLANDNEKKMNDKAERVALGTDMPTVRQAVMHVLQEQGIIKQTDSDIPDIKDPDKAAENSKEVAALGEDNNSSKDQAVNAALKQAGLEG